jgi:hypothetical protein
VKPHSEAVRKDLVVKKPNYRGHGIPVTVDQEVKDWLIAMVQKHWYLYLCRETGGLRIAFCNHNDAMKFKLAWH